MRPGWSQKGFIHGCLHPISLTAETLPGGSSFIEVVMTLGLRDPGVFVWKIPWSFFFFF